MSEKRAQDKFRAEMDAIQDSAVPILGVCFGHQMIAHTFGADVVKDGKHVLGMVKTTIVADDGLFEGLPRSLTLLESRHEVVKSIPIEFRLLARSTTSEIAAMKHTSRPIYGIQSHPERHTKENQDGNRLVENFVRLLR
jgi:GMP synthase (glutamine-hydrolysing)